MVLPQFHADFHYFTWIYVVGVAACLAMTAFLVGCAFWRHAAETPLPWEFAACAGVWLVFQPAVLTVASREAQTANPTSIPTSLLLKQLVEQGAVFGAVATTAIYVWAFRRRHPPRLIGRLALTFTATVAVALISICLWSIDAEQFWTRYPGFTAESLSRSGYRGVGRMLAQFLEGSRLPSWDAAIGWIVWYVGLFGGTAAGASKPESAT